LAVDETYVETDASHLAVCHGGQGRLWKRTDGNILILILQFNQLPCNVDLFSFFTDYFGM
jgi:hypothetical protein